MLLIITPGNAKPPKRVVPHVERQTFTLAPRNAKSNQARVGYSESKNAVYARSIIRSCPKPILPRFKAHPSASAYNP
jgi:hypothetical protein